MITIWKFPFKTTDEIDLEMPAGSVPLAVQIQDGTPNLWAQVDSEATIAPRHFIIYGTGHPMDPDPGDYVGTWQESNEAWHMFETEKP